MVVYADGIGGLINPAMAEYVIVTEQYITSKTNSGGLASKIELNDVEIEGPYVKATGLFIPRRWDVGLMGSCPIRWCPTARKPRPTTGPSSTTCPASSSTWTPGKT